MWGEETGSENPPQSQGSASEYVIGPQDVIEIKVWDNPDLSGKAVVSLDGSINYYLIGKVKAEGLTPAQLREKIASKLADGYIVNPQVSVEILEYKSKKIILTGEVEKPGTYYLTRKTTVVEAITMAGGQTKDADREIFIVRDVESDAKESEKERANPPPPEEETVPATETSPDSDRPPLPKKGKQILIDLRAALEGDLSQNIYVLNGDYIFVPRSKTFFIMGEVKKPGQYNLDRGTTLLRAISLAGGLTEKASLRRTHVIRTVDNRKKEIKIDGNDLIEPGDIIVVPESIF